MPKEELMGARHKRSGEDTVRRERRVKAHQDTIEEGGSSAKHMKKKTGAKWNDIESQTNARIGLTSTVKRSELSERGCLVPFCT